MQLGYKNEARVVKYEDFNIKLDSANSKKSVLVGGCFDILHFGHIEFLKKAKEIGDFLIVALESDEFIKSTKKKLPVHNQTERAKMLGQLRSVDLVILLPLFSNFKSYEDLVRNVKPSIIAVTEGDSQIENKKRQADSVGAEVKVVCPNLKKFASSKIVSYASIFSD